MILPFLPARKFLRNARAILEVRLASTSRIQESIVFRILHDLLFPLLLLQRKVYGRDKTSFRSSYPVHRMVVFYRGSRLPPTTFSLGIVKSSKSIGRDYLKLCEYIFFRNITFCKTGRKNVLERYIILTSSIAIHIQ